MSKRYQNSILETVGNTPLVKLNRVTADIKATVLAKVEFFNPGGSVKDRIAIAMIDAAEKEGTLKPGGTIVESTSGNTGAGLALVAALRGYKAIFTMPDKMSQEKVRNLKAFGAEVIVTPTAVAPESPESYYSVAKKIVQETPNAILANQYFNPVNPEAHYLTTGPEIWEQTDGKVNYFVAGMGTGGTISGTGKFLKEKNANLQVVGADPVGSILKNYFNTQEIAEAKPYKVEGVGEDIIPSTIHFEYIDRVIDVGDKESFNTARRISREEGILIGGSGGLAAAAALQVARDLAKDQTVVVLFPDSGVKYLSTFYSDDWMRENRFWDIASITLDRALAVKSSGMNSLISVSPSQTVREAIALLSKHNISQIPVFESTRPIGHLEEGDIMAKVISDNKLFDAPVKEVMLESLPVISSKRHIFDAKNYLTSEYPAVLVEDSGKITGIITKSDLLEYLAE